ncbi:MAG: GTP-binding protein [Enterocloster sp.]|uniref:GTP-binding protein n=1 Tax=Enterocloster sp. TaxID=2719315 RepID=UPI00399A1C19
MLRKFLGPIECISGKSYDFCGVICLVDAVNFIDQLTDLETVYRQLKHCHLAVITKSDLVDSSKMADLEKKIREINRGL